MLHYVASSCCQFFFTFRLTFVTFIAACVRVCQSDCESVCVCVEVRVFECECAGVCVYAPQLPIFISVCFTFSFRFLFSAVVLLQLFLLLLIWLLLAFHHQLLLPHSSFLPSRPGWQDTQAPNTFAQPPLQLDLRFSGYAGSVPSSPYPLTFPFGIAPIALSPCACLLTNVMFKLQTELLTFDKRQLRRRLSPAIP